MASYPSIASGAFQVRLAKLLGWACLPALALLALRAITKLNETQASTLSLELGEFCQREPQVSKGRTGRQDFGASFSRAIGYLDKLDKLVDLLAAINH